MRERHRRGSEHPLRPKFAAQNRTGGDCGGQDARRGPSGEHGAGALRGEGRIIVERDADPSHDRRDDDERAGEGCAVAAFEHPQVSAGQSANRCTRDATAGSGHVALGGPVPSRAQPGHRQGARKAGHGDECNRRLRCIAKPHPEKDKHEQEHAIDAQRSCEFLVARLYANNVHGERRHRRSRADERASAARPEDGPRQLRDENEQAEPNQQLPARNRKHAQKRVVRRRHDGAHDGMRRDEPCADQHDSEGPTVRRAVHDRSRVETLPRKDDRRDDADRKIEGQSAPQRLHPRRSRDQKAPEEQKALHVARIGRAYSACANFDFTRRAAARVKVDSASPRSAMQSRRRWSKGESRAPSRDALRSYPQ